MADIAGAPDEPITAIVCHGGEVTIPPPKWRHRNYYIAPIGWRTEDLLTRAPDAKIKLVRIRPEMK
jgi:hypothetical protein